MIQREPEQMRQMTITTSMGPFRLESARDSAELSLNRLIGFLRGESCFTECGVPLLGSATRRTLVDGSR